MSVTVAYIIGAIAALVCTILSLVLITPASKRPTLPKFFQALHDIFNFKALLIEKILKFFYILSTLGCIFIGFFMLFSGYETYDYGFYGMEKKFQSMAGVGFLVMIVGPIVIRLAYEGIMLIIIAVKNVIEINNKLKNQNENENKPARAAAPAPNFAPPAYQPQQSAPAYQPYQAPVEQTPPQPEQPAAAAAPVPEEWVFCMNCGTKYDKSKGGCPNCGAN